MLTKNYSTRTRRETTPCSVKASISLFEHHVETFPCVKPICIEVYTILMNQLVRLKVIVVGSVIVFVTI